MSISMKKIIKNPLWLLVVLIMISCSKEAGEGGSSTISGKVWVKDYNSTFTILNGEYYAQDEDVYIIYGDYNGYGDHLKTDYRGSYEFKYLRPGKYRIYVYSKDSTMLSPSGIIPMVEEVEITANKQNVEAPLITIFK